MNTCAPLRTLYGWEECGGLVLDDEDIYCRNTRAEELAACEAADRAVDDGEWSDALRAEEDVCEKTCWRCAT